MTRGPQACAIGFFLWVNLEKKEEKRGVGEPGARAALPPMDTRGRGKQKIRLGSLVQEPYLRGVFPGTLDKRPPQQKKVMGGG